MTPNVCRHHLLLLATHAGDAVSDVAAHPGGLDQPPNAAMQPPSQCTRARLPPALTLRPQVLRVRWECTL